MKLPAGCLDLVTWNIDDNLVNTVTYIVLTMLCLCIFHGIETDNRPIFCTQSTVIIYIQECLFNCNCNAKFVSLSIYIGSYYILQAPYIMICKTENKILFIIALVIMHLICFG